MIDVAVWSCVITHISTGQSPAQLRLRSSHAHKSYLPTHAHHHHHHLFFPTHGYKILFVWYSFLMIRFRFESKLRMNGKNTLWIYSIKLKPSSTWLTSNKCEEGVPLLWTYDLIPGCTGWRRKRWFLPTLPPSVSRGVALLLLPLVHQLVHQLLQLLQPLLLLVQSPSNSLEGGHFKGEKRSFRHFVNHLNAETLILT